MNQENRIQFLQCKIQFQNFVSGCVYKIVEWSDDAWTINDGEQAVKLDFKTTR